MPRYIAMGKYAVGSVRSVGAIAQATEEGKRTYVAIGAYEILVH